MEEELDLKKQHQGSPGRTIARQENKQSIKSHLTQENRKQPPSRSFTNYLFDYTYLFTLGGIILAIDQWTKWLIRENLAFGETWMPLKWLASYFRIVHWKNSGAAFGLFQGFGGVFTILAILVAAAIIYYFPQVPRKDWSLRLAMSLQLGGALGNLIDRLTIGEVTDFISIGAFPVFNIADASISIGVAVLVIGIWFGGEDAKEDKVEPIEEIEPDKSNRLKTRNHTKQINTRPSWNTPPRNINPISEDREEDG